MFLYDFLTIGWDVGKGIPIGNFSIRFYQIFFASGFVVGFYLMKGFFKREGIAQEVLDQLLTYMVIATVIGARLGHVFFYQWDYYSQHPVEILKVWEGGLASHGAAIAIIIALYFFSKKVSKKSTLWILDKVVVTVALAGCFIRMGNMFNSEIYGKLHNSSIETVYLDLPRQSILGNWPEVEAVYFTNMNRHFATDSLQLPEYTMDVVFSKTTSQPQAEQMLAQQMRYLNGFGNDEKNIIIGMNPPQWQVDSGHQVATLAVLGMPRFPSQLVEASAYLLIFFLLLWMYQKGLWKREGLLFGMFLITVFGFRFFVEYMKVVQVEAEYGMSLNLGQQLSIPLVLIGLFFVARAFTQKSVKHV